MSSRYGGSGQKRAMENDDDFVETPIARKTRARLKFSEEKASGKRIVEDVNIEEMVKEVDVALTNSGESPIGNFSIGARRKFPTVFRYSDSDLHGILSHAPTGEEEMLRKMDFEHMLYEGMTGIFRGAYSFILVVDKFRKIAVDWRHKKLDIKELENKVKELETDLEQQKIKSREYMYESADRHGRIRYMECENEKLLKDLEGSREYAGGLLDVVETLTDQLTFAYGKYKETVDYRETLQAEFCRGFEVCKEQVSERYKELDMKWLDEGTCYVNSNESEGTTSGVKFGSCTKGLEHFGGSPEI